MQDYYTSKEYKIGIEYKAPPETTALLMRKTFDIKFNEEIEMFGLLSILIKILKAKCLIKVKQEEL